MAFTMWPHTAAKTDKENTGAKDSWRCVMHLENLPPDVTDVGIRNVCANYGDVLAVERIHQRARLITFASRQ